VAAGPFGVHLERLIDRLGDLAAVWLGLVDPRAPPTGTPKKTTPSSTMSPVSFRPMCTVEGSSTKASPGPYARASQSFFRKASCARSAASARFPITKNRALNSPACSSAKNAAKSGGADSAAGNLMTSPSACITL
jgi:hypothetical protein